MLHKQWLMQHGSVQGLFTHFYESNFWGNDESRSGPGSTASSAANLRAELPRLLGKLDVQCMLDAPCGDYNWFQHVERPSHVRYIGGDIVQPLIDRNQSVFGRNNVEFITLDITRDELPDADLWLCRDCLIHFSYRDIYKALANFLRSNITYLLATTHPLNHVNRNIPTGHFQMLNLQRPPFNFSPALLLIDDWVEKTNMRQLGLWHRQTLAADLSANKAFQKVARQR